MYNPTGATGLEESVVQVDGIENLPKGRGAHKVTKALDLSATFQVAGKQASANADPQWHHAGEFAGPCLEQPESCPS